MNPTSIHVCFVALKAYPLLSGREDVRHIGGAEVQQTLLARGLLARGYSVSFVTLDHGQPDAEDLGGISVYRAYRPDAGLPGLRFIHPRATRVWAAMRRAQADVYFQRTSDPLAGLVAAFCRRHLRRFVFSVGHDGDCEPALPFCSGLRERIPYRYGLRRAQAVVAQTRHQQQRLLANFSVNSIVIPSCTADPGPAEPIARRPDARPRVLWIGRFAPEKRLELLLDVARLCADLGFDVLGDGPDTPYVRGLNRQAAALPNLDLRGYVPHARVDAFYRQAAALLCTSGGEGFPNTFLEAWSRQVPVVSTFDPDGILASQQIGLPAQTASELADALRRVCADRDFAARLAQRARRYYQDHHTVAAAVTAYDHLFQQLTGLAPRSANQPGPFAEVT